VTLGDAEIALTSFEFSLLHALAQRAGRVLSRERLLDLARGGDDEGPGRSIDVHIARLRQKLGDDERSPRLLRAIRDAGYVLSPVEH
jgi:DNA-binding response OmpR family regulator